VDATIINAPSSTKNARQERDPEMHQTRKGKQWFFGMKAHVGVDSQTKLIHSVVATAANAADCTMLPHLLHGAETRVWGDQAYRGQSEVLRKHAPHALDFTHQRYRYKHLLPRVGTNAVLVQRFLRYLVTESQTIGHKLRRIPPA